MTTQALAELISNIFITIAFLTLFVLLALEKKRPKVDFSKTTSKESVFTNFTAFFFNNILKAVPSFAGASREAARVLATRAAGARVSSGAATGATGAAAVVMLVRAVLSAAMLIWMRLICFA